MFNIWLAEPLLQAPRKLEMTNPVSFMSACSIRIAPQAIHRTGLKPREDFATADLAQVGSHARLFGSA